MSASCVRPHDTATVEFGDAQRLPGDSEQRELDPSTTFELVTDWEHQRTGSGGGSE